MNPSRPKAKLSRALGIPLTPKSVKYFERRPFPHRPLAAPYLDTSLADLTFTLIREPQRTEIPVICDEQLVVEFYSR